MTIKVKHINKKIKETNKNKTQIFLDRLFSKKKKKEKKNYRGGVRMLQILNDFSRTRALNIYGGVEVNTSCVCNLRVVT